MTATWAPLITAIAFFGAAMFAAAIITRLSTDRQMPGIITNGIDAMANIFKGVFRG